MAEKVEGRGPNLEAAVWHAWEKAKENNAKAGGTQLARKNYPLEIYIEASNPIHSYVVTIDPT